MFTMSCHSIVNVHFTEFVKRFLIINWCIFLGWNGEANIKLFHKQLSTTIEFPVCFIPTKPPFFTALHHTAIIRKLLLSYQTWSRIKTNAHLKKKSSLQQCYIILPTLVHRTGNIITALFLYMNTKLLGYTKSQMWCVQSSQLHYSKYYENVIKLNIKKNIQTTHEIDLPVYMIEYTSCLYRLMESEYKHNFSRSLDVRAQHSLSQSKIN